MTKKEKSDSTEKTKSKKLVLKPDLTQEITDEEAEKFLKESLVEDDDDGNTWSMHVGLGPKIVLNDKEKDDSKEPKK